MFQANLQAFSRQLTCNFRTFTFYTGPSDEVEDSLAMCFFKVCSRYSSMGCPRPSPARPSPPPRARAVHANICLVTETHSDHWAC